MVLIGRNKVIIEFYPELEQSSIKNLNNKRDRTFLLNQSKESLIQYKNLRCIKRKLILSQISIKQRDVKIILIKKHASQYTYKHGKKPYLNRTPGIYIDDKMVSTKKLFGNREFESIFKELIY